MQATAETINFDQDALVHENVPAMSRPFDYRDMGAPVVNQAAPAIELHPYEGPALEGSSNANSATLSANALKKLCASASPKLGGIFQRPEITDNTMYDPGQNDQTTVIGFNFAAVNPACNGHFLRQVTVLPELIRHGHIIKELPSPERILNTNAASKPNFGAVESLNEPKLFWQDGDKARVVLQILDRDVTTKKIVKQTTKIEPVKVEH